MKNKIGSLKKYEKGDKVKYGLEIDGLEVMLTTRQLLDQKIQFRAQEELIYKKNKFYIKIPRKEWLDVVRKLTDKMEIIKV